MALCSYGQRVRRSYGVLATLATWRACWQPTDCSLAQQCLHLAEADVRASKRGADFHPQAVIDDQHSRNETLWNVFPIFGRDFIPAA